MVTGDSKSARQGGGEGAGDQRHGEGRTDERAGQSRYVYLLSVIGAIGGLLWGYDTGVIAGALSPLAYVVDYAVIELGWAWRPMFAVGVIPPAALAIGMLFLPDTPRWLGSEGRWNEAGDVLERVAPREARSEMRCAGSGAAWPRPSAPGSRSSSGAACAGP